MITRLYLATSMVLAGILLSAVAEDAAAPALVVSGALPQSGQLTIDELSALGAVDVEWAPQNETHKFRGVALENVLTHFGFSAGAHDPDTPKSEKLAGWRKVVVATAADGFQAVYSCAELFETVGATRAYVVWEMDGKPLGDDIGPLRIVVPTDKMKFRCLFQVERLNVVDVGQTATLEKPKSTPERN